MGRLTHEQILEIPKLLRRGYSEVDIARTFKCSKAAISRGVRGSRTAKASQGNIKKGRPRLYTEKQRKIIIKMLKKHKQLGTRRLVAIVNSSAGTNISDRTLRSIAKEAKFKFNFPVKKPLLTDADRKARCNFARAHKNTD